MTDDPKYEAFRNRADGIRNNILSVAVIIGGAWAIFQFGVVQWPETRKALFAQAEVNVKVDAKEERIADAQSYIAGRVELSNIGTRNVFLDYSSGRLLVQRLVGADGGIPRWAEDQTPPLEWASRVLRSGEIDTLTFVVPVSAQGLYRVAFQVPLPLPELEEHNRVASEFAKAPQQSKQIFWQGSAIVNIHGSAKSTASTPEKPSTTRRERPMR